MDSGGLKQIPSLLWSLGQGTGGFFPLTGGSGRTVLLQTLLQTLQPLLQTLQTPCCRHCISCCRHCHSCCRHCIPCCRHCNPCCRHCNPCCRHCSPSPELAIPEHLANHPLNPAAARLLRRITHTFNQSLFLPSLGVSVRL